MFAETHTPDNHNYYTITMNDQVGIVDLLIDPKTAIGKDFHYECEMTMPDTPVGNALTEMAGFLSGGQPDIISIDGRVIFCDDEVAVVKVFHHYGEFDLYMFSYMETAERFPGFEDKNHVRESCYAWVSLEDGWFIPSDPALLKGGEEMPKELEDSIMSLYEEFKNSKLVITLHKDELIKLDPGAHGNDDTNLYSGINRAVHWMENTECAILTAWKDENTRSQNDADNKDLQQSLRTNGFGVIRVKGVANWGKENSFLTFCRESGAAQSFYDTVFNLSRFYNQDCFLYKEPGLLSPACLIGTNEAFGIGRKENLGLVRINEMSPEAYSEIGSGTISFTKEEN